MLDNVTSDHSPTSFDATGKKLKGEVAPFNVVPNGIPGLAARLPILFSEGVKKGRIDLATFIAIGATNAARLMGLWPRKGTIAVGADADLAICDPEREVKPANALMHHGVDDTPYEGMAVTGEPGHGISLPRGPHAPVQPPGRG